MTMDLTERRLPPAARRVQTYWQSPRSAKWKGQRALWSTFAFSRLLVILIPLGLFPYLDGNRIGNDVNLYSSWAQVLLSGHYPVADPMWQYPPLAGFVFIVTTQVIAHPLIGFMTFALLVDFAIFFVLLRQGKGNLAGAWTWAIGGLAIGPVLLTRFDLFPTLFAVMALLMIAKPVRSAVWLGVGTLLKVWPVFLLVAYPRRELPKAIAALGATCFVGMTILSLWGLGLLSFLKEQGDRGLQIESVGAIFYVVAQFLGVHVDPVFRYGSLEVDATGAGLVATLVTIAGFGAMGWVAYGRLRGRLENIAPADIALVITLISIASSRVFSPQYMIWVAGIAAVCMLDRRTLMKPVIYILLPVAILGQAVYPLSYGVMMHGGWYGVLFQLARISLLVWATVWATLLIMRPRTDDSRTISSAEEDQDRGLRASR